MAKANDLDKSLVAWVKSHCQLSTARQAVSVAPTQGVDHAT
jgi:hypothetical protein